jgi:hypothetical protein
MWKSGDSAAPAIPAAWLKLLLPPGFRARRRPQAAAVEKSR